MFRSAHFVSLNDQMPNVCLLVSKTPRNMFKIPNYPKQLLISALINNKFTRCQRKSQVIKAVFAAVWCLGCTLEQLHAVVLSANVTT